MRFAIKVALSLTLAFMIPMALGWPQASTAAITVLIIAATGDMHESMMKGMLRLIGIVLGTVLGAVLGLGLIALFAQERLAYLLVTSVVIALLLYSYSAYRGDGTIFMLAAAVTLVLRALLAAVRTPIACDGARRPWPADAR